MYVCSSSNTTMGNRSGGNLLPQYKLLALKLFTPQLKVDWSWKMLPHLVSWCPCPFKNEAYRPSVENYISFLLNRQTVFKSLISDKSHKFLIHGPCKTKRNFLKCDETEEKNTATHLHVLDVLKARLNLLVPANEDLTHTFFLRNMTQVNEVCRSH